MDIIGPIIGGFEMIMEMLQSGGVITYLILLLGVYGLIISIRKILYLRKISKIDATEIMGTVTASMEKGGAIEALKNISHYRNPVSKIISIGLIGTVLGIWMTFKNLGIDPSATAMAEGIYIALITTIVGLTVVIILLPLHTYIESLVEMEMDKIELATKMTNWSYGVIKIRVYEKMPCVIEALQEAEGIVNVREITDPYSNIQISFKPSMLEKSISNIILEKCDVKSEITESKLRQ